jgi:hypothetical protein
MSHARMRRPVLVMLAWMAACPSEVFAQAAIGGWVKDASGSVLPGVTVAASSPALIEKIRTAITDGTGQYRIENLRPGVYTVTFTCEGFGPHIREGVELSGSLTATVNAELAIGSLTTMITVAGERAVDIHAANREIALANDLVRALPTVRSYNALVILVPGVVTNVNDTVTGTAATQFPIHGGRVTEGRLLLDGLTVGSPPSGNSPTSYIVDVGNAEEITFSSPGDLGEAETAGLVINIVPKTGGNTNHGSFFASGSGERFQSDNLTPSLNHQGLVRATPLTAVYDFSASFGGPVLKDRGWFFVNAQSSGSTREVADVYYNVNAGDPSRWLYVPDVSRPEYSDRTFENVSARLTWQLTSRNKVGAFWDEQATCRNCTGATPGLQEPARVSPEAVGTLGRPLRLTQATWSSPQTTRLLLEAGFVGVSFGVGNFERTPNPTRSLIRVAEQCASGCANNGGIPGLVYRSQDFSVAHTSSYLWKGSVSYVTGAHSTKAGFQHALMTDDRKWMTNDQNLTYRFDNGVPNQLTQSISPWINNARAAWRALYLQQKWTRNGLTLQGAVRFDHAWSWFPAQQEGPSRFLQTPIVIPETRGVDSYKDVTPRMSVAYDPSGHGKTVFRISLGKYLESVGVTSNYANVNPTLRMPRTTPAFGTAGVTRAWNDANGNRVPDCDLLSPGAQDLRGSGGDLCGVISDTSFGKNVLTNNLDTKILRGWGVRPSDWELGLSIQRQIGGRASVEASYRRRWYHGFFVVDNTFLQPSDLTPFELTAPKDPRLPGGGGYTISGLYDVVPDKAGQVGNLVADSSHYGKWFHYFNGIDLTFNLRTVAGLTFMGGTSTGQTVADNCDVRARLPELATTTTGTSAFGAGLNGSVVSTVSPYCHVAFGILTQFRGLASYVFPRADIQVSSTFQSKPGVQLAANYVAPNSAVAPSLGRDLSANAQNVTVNIVAPGTMYGDRITELDLRVAKVFQHGGLRTLVAVDLYNALNSSAALSYNAAFIPGGTWPQPIAIQAPRLIKLTAEVTF